MQITKYRLWQKNRHPHVTQLGSGGTSDRRSTVVRCLQAVTNLNFRACCPRVVGDDTGTSTSIHS